jgi:uncharacterized membrane-anchored protein YitT (DUF2179 family)
MAFITKEKVFSKKWFIAYGLIIIGSFILATAFVLFITPYQFVPGGVYGISIILHYLFGTPVGMVALAFDIPLTIIGIKILGPRFGVKTVVGFVLTAVFVDTLTYFWGNLPLIENDALLSAIFGGVLSGLGLGLIFKSKATSGGTDIVAMILSKYTSMPLGQLMVIVDSVIVFFGLFFFRDWKIPFYSLIIIYITGKVIDVVLQGLNYEKTVFIISEKSEEIRQKILVDLHRGGTYISAKGMWNQENKNLIFTVITPRELTILKDFIHKTDPGAFVTVMNANEILGEGFKSLNEDLSN